MKACNFLLVLFLVLVPSQHFQNCDPKGVSCDYASGYDPRIRDDNQAPDSNMSNGYYSKASEDTFQEDGDTVPVKVHYEFSDAEKCSSGRKTNLNEEELTHREVEIVKESTSKGFADKYKKQMSNCLKSDEKVVKVDFAKPEQSCNPLPKSESVLCADCEECELQVKSNGEGVMIKCKNCREMAPHEVNFPSGNNKKIITLP